MRIKEWIFILAIAGLGMMTANFIGFDVAFQDSLPGVLVLLGIALCAAGFCGDPAEAAHGGILLHPGTAVCVPHLAHLRVLSSRRQGRSTSRRR